MLKRLFLFSIYLLSSVFITAQDLQQLNQQVVDLYKKGEYRQAIPFAEKAVTLTGKSFGENNPNYVRILNILVIIYMKSGEYEKAEPAATRCMQIWKNIAGETSEDYISSMNILAQLYNTTGQYTKAENILIQCMSAEKKARGENSLQYATIQDYLGRLYVELKRYEKAEPLLLQAKETRKRISGTNQMGYQNTLMELAGLYRGMREYEKAINYCLEAREITRQLLGENHHQFITSQVTLAMLYIDYRQFSKAEPLLIQALESIKKVNGEVHRDYAAALSVLGQLYLTSGNAEKAEPVSLQALNITKKIFGEYHPLYSKALNNLGVIYKTMHQYQKSESYYLQSKELTAKIWGEDHPEYESVLSNLAILYAATGQFEKAIPLIVTGNKINLKSISITFSVLSDKEKSAFLQKSIYPFDFANSVLFQLKKRSPQLLRENFNHLLVLKSMALADTRGLLEAIREKNDPEINAIFNNWKTNKQLLARQYALPVNYRKPDLSSLVQQTESLEKELNRRSMDFRNNQSSIQVSMSEVQDKLMPGEAAVEFVKFQLYDKDWKDSMIYAAYVVKKNDAVPQFIPLCEEKQLQKLFNTAGKTVSTMVNSFYRGAAENINSFPAGDSLYKLVWQPLESYLKGINTVCYSPAGLLFTIAFNALPAGDGKLLMDRYRLEQMTSTRQVALRSPVNKIIAPFNIALFGNASFSEDSLQLIKQKTIVPDNTTAVKFSIRGYNNSAWSSLPGTAAEVQKIRELFAKNKIHTSLYTGSGASEENLKALGRNSVQVIHIATHGFFLPEGSRENRNRQTDAENSIVADDPLLRSGLILAGANYVWSGKVPLEGIEDGICTAYEISQMNLSNTELVVLSACETALGDIKGSEGVFGLQRGFKMAGVKNMIVSLWQVPDKETAELMTLFYTNWLNKKNIGESFYQAQAEMKKKYPPFYWAAFVLVE